MRVLLVDGHSAIFGWPEMRRLHDRRTAAAREAVIKKLTAYQDYTGEHVVAVFDGKGGRTQEVTEPGGIQVFYSGTDQTADDIIERLAAKYGETHDITVATDDHLEQTTVMTFGALAISATALWERLEEAERHLARDLKRVQRDSRRSR